MFQYNIFILFPISIPDKQLSSKMIPFILLLVLCLPHSPYSLTQDGLFLIEARSLLSFPSSSPLSSWNPLDPSPCNWNGVSCSSSTARVTSLNLSNAALSGPFPLSLCKLPALASLDLSYNSINSTLPSGIDACRNLSYLNLTENLVSGSIPGSLANIPGLRLLDLSYNSLSGGFPADFARFASLEFFSVVSNVMNGTIPGFLGNVTSLRHLQLAYNPFEPSKLPAELGNLTNVVELWLSGCGLFGEIPDRFGDLKKLTSLDLSTNNLTGVIPASLAGLSSIYQIEMFENSLHGELPVEMANLTTLRRLDVSTNQLTGRIPPELCGLQLSSLNLMENGFEGTLPANIANSTNLYELKVFKNSLTGTLPSLLGSNSPLLNLDMSYNHFYGEIPPNLCAKGTLEELILISNKFSGEIPVSLGGCQSLMRVRLRNNQLSGSVPEGLWGLPHLYLLELCENSFSGNVPDGIQSAYNLSRLDVSQNMFSGTVPNGIGSLSSLVELLGSNNNFTGEIPVSIVNLNRLSTLDLHGNELSGVIPDRIIALSKLNELNLANNRLSGGIPPEIGSLTVLNYLDLSMNSLTGQIPLQLQNLRLNFLNLSYNRLSGDIPTAYTKDMYRNSFLGNPGLCSDQPGTCSKMSDRRGNFKYLWLLSLIFVLAAVVLVAGVGWFYCKYTKFKKSNRGIILSKWRSFHKLGFSELDIAESFKEDNVIGSGASGKVYRVELSNGEVVAVKKLWVNSNKYATVPESEKDGFQVEVETLGKIRHKNIVRLWCCFHNGDCKMLVYEYMPNGSLGDVLHGGKGSSLDWRTRLKIALDAAEGLSYLHHDCVPPIVHRDVKSNNILLDVEFGAKVADFGLAKIIGVGKGDESMSVIAGSYGYIAPEYAYTLRVNEKSDIYSFGVVILELVTGRKPIDPAFVEKDLVKWVQTSLDQKGADRVLDPSLDPSYNDEIRRVLEIGLLCTQTVPVSRPSMRKVVKLLVEAGGGGNRSRNPKKEGKLTPYLYEDGLVLSQSDVSMENPICKD